VESTKKNEKKKTRTAYVGVQKGGGTNMLLHYFGDMENSEKIRK